MWSFKTEPINDDPGSIKEIIRQVLQETAEEEKMVDLSAVQLRKWFRETMKYAMKGESSLISYSNISCPKRSFHTFVKILCKACKEIGITMTDYKATDGLTVYIKYDLDQVRSELEMLFVPNIDIDEKVRAMLHDGPYR